MSALAARRSWVAFCPSVAHKQKLRSLSCLRALNQIRLANPPCLLLAILHCLSKYTRPVVRRQQHLTGWELPEVLSRPCLGLWACSVSDAAFFYYLISVSSSSSKCTGPLNSQDFYHCSTRTLQQQTQLMQRFKCEGGQVSVSSWQQWKVTWEGAELEVSVCVNCSSCWATQHPHFIWPIITQRSLLSKYQVDRQPPCKEMLVKGMFRPLKAAEPTRAAKHQC